MNSPSATHERYPYQNEPTWSRSVRAIARAVFDAALDRELHELMQEVKQMASQIKQPSDLWDLEQYLTQRRKDIDRKYEFRPHDSPGSLGHSCANVKPVKRSYAAYSLRHSYHRHRSPGRTIRYKGTQGCLLQIAEIPNIALQVQP